MGNPASNSQAPKDTTSYVDFTQLTPLKPHEMPPIQDFTPIIQDLALSALKPSEQTANTNHSLIEHNVTALDELDAGKTTLFNPCKTEGTPAHAPSTDNAEFSLDDFASAFSPPPTYEPPKSTTIEKQHAIPKNNPEIASTMNRIAYDFSNPILIRKEFDTPLLFVEGKNGQQAHWQVLDKTMISKLSPNEQRLLGFVNRNNNNIILSPGLREFAGDQLHVAIFIAHPNASHHEELANILNTSTRQFIAINQNDWNRCFLPILNLHSQITKKEEGESHESHAHTLGTAKSTRLNLARSSLSEHEVDEVREQSEKSALRNKSVQANQTEVNEIVAEIRRFKNEKKLFEMDQEHVEEAFNQETARLAAERLKIQNIQKQTNAGGN